MDIQSLMPKEKNLSGILCQEVMEILHILRFKLINQDSGTLGFSIPIFVNNVPVIAFLATTEQGIELSAQWDNRKPLKTHYLLKAGFVNFPLLQECLLVLEAVWHCILLCPPDAELMGRDWDQEIKNAVVELKRLREERIKTLYRLGKDIPSDIHGVPTPSKENGSQVTGGVDIKIIAEGDAKQVAIMQEIEEEQI